ncbi:hypothetical protein [Methylotenera versatilis]|uniref:hypothetical protein n=1 Tax=Methylotenera versatilis TaxID=1055487 RepID=UPI001F4004BE|nr:hypothetical protein [Methylotenera versatilis]
MNSNQFNRPLYLNSEESSDNLKGEIYAVVNHPFAKVNTALNNPAHWCDVLILHINIKYCQASSNKNGAVLNVNLGKKYDQSLEDTSRVEFNYREIVSSADYFAIQLNAEKGPLGTSNYRIWIESIPLKNGQTFLHFTYTYSFGLTGRVAMKTYLATIGRDKVGFTRTNKQVDSNPPDYIQGVRGVVERNTMRYYLAIDAYLATLNIASDSMPEKRFQLWYTSNENYPRQLHEVEQAEYMAMKRKEYKRQQTAL